MTDVTTPKQGKKSVNWVVVLIPIAIVAALVLAFALPPSHAFIVNGPLKPLFTRIGMTTPARALAAKPDAPLDPAAEVQRLNNELSIDRKSERDKDARIAQLQAEVSKAQAPPDAPASAPAAKPSPTAVPQDLKRAASYWAAMDAEKAADLAQRLPAPYVRAVFGQMPAEAVAEIMNVMPARVAATLTAQGDAERP